MRTGDLYLAAAVEMSGHRVLRVARQGHRALFEFGDSPEAASIVDAYFSGELPLDASAYAERIRQMKGRAMAVREAAA